MLIGAVGYLTGYNGTFPFEKPGDLYHDHNYVGMRIVSSHFFSNQKISIILWMNLSFKACTAMGACLVPFSYFTVWELTNSVTASGIAGALVLFGKLDILNMNCQARFELGVAFCAPFDHSVLIVANKLSG